MFLSFSYLEWLGVVSGGVCVWFNTKRNIWGWPIGILSVISYVIICYQAKLYAEMCLQLFYGLSAVYGWYAWASNKKKNSQQETSIACRKLNNKQWLLYSVAGMSLSISIFLILKRFTDGSLPIWDSLTTGFSLVAQYLLAQRYLENWLIWVAINVVSIGIFYYKALPLTSGLYGIYLLMAIHGYKQWNNEISSQKIG